MADRDFRVFGYPDPLGGRQKKHFRHPAPSSRFRTLATQTLQTSFDSHTLARSRHGFQHDRQHTEPNSTHIQLSTSNLHQCTGEAHEAASQVQHGQSNPNGFRFGVLTSWHVTWHVHGFMFKMFWVQESWGLLPKLWFDYEITMSALKEAGETPQEFQNRKICNLKHLES